MRVISLLQGELKYLIFLWINLWPTLYQFPSPPVGIHFWPTLYHCCPFSPWQQSSLCTCCIVEWLSHFDAWVFGFCEIEVFWYVLAKSVSSPLALLLGLGHDFFPLPPPLFFPLFKNYFVKMFLVTKMTLKSTKKKKKKKKQNKQRTPKTKNKTTTFMEKNKNFGKYSGLNSKIFSNILEKKKKKTVDFIRFWHN